MSVRQQRIARLVLPRWYYVASAFLILRALEAFSIIDRFVYGAWPGKTGDKLTRSLNVLLILVSVALFARRSRGTTSVGPGANLALGLACLLLCSALWSVDPIATLRQGVVYLPVVVGAIGIASNIDADEYMDLLARLCFWTAMASLILLAVHPASAVDEVGNFQGIYSQKNVLGEAMQIGALASLHGVRAGNGRRLRSGVYLAGNIVLAIMSASTTSCLVIFVFCGVSAVIALVRRGGVARLVGIAGALVALPAVLYIVAVPDPLLEALGKSPTLTGRTELWAAVLPNIWRRPLLGWGYNAFWSPHNVFVSDIWRSVGWSMGQAHNGALEMLLEVGFVGTAYFLFLFARNVAVAIRCLRTAQRELAVTCLLFCVGTVILGVSEEVLVAALGATTSVFFITGFMCEKAVRTADGRAARAAHVIAPCAPVATSSPAAWRMRRSGEAGQGHGWRQRSWAGHSWRRRRPGSAVPPGDSEHLTRPV